MTVFNSIGVLGAGTVGSSVAARIAVEGKQVVLVDTKPEFIERALKDIRKQVSAGIQADVRGAISSEAEIMARIHGTCDTAPLKDLPFVLECIPEDVEAKHDTLKVLGELCRETAIFGTSVTSVTVKELAEDLPCFDRIVGFHFYAPDASCPLVELIPSEGTSPDAVHIADKVARAMGAVTVRSDDVPGFIVKRVQSALFAESIRMLNEGGINTTTIDAAASEALGIPGPFALMNEKGIHLAEFAARGLSGRLPELYIPPERLRAQAATGEPWNSTGDIDAEKKASLIDRFMGLVLYSAFSMRDEDVASAEDINWAVRYGVGVQFGPFDLFNKIGHEQALGLVSAMASSKDLAVPEGLSSFSSKTGELSLSYVITDIYNNVARVTVRRPDTGNALDDTLVSQLETAVKKIERNETVRTVVYTGMGGAILSGPPKEFFTACLEKNDAEGILSLHRRIHGLFAKVADSEKITVARTRGRTEGAGFEFALACNYLVAASQTLFVFPETGLGIHPALGGTQRLPRKVGKSVGKYVIMTGETLTAEAAERLGVVDAVIDDDDAVPILTANLQGTESLSDDELGPSDEELAAISLFNGTQCIKTLRGDLPSDNPAAERVASILSTKAPAALTLVNKLIDDGLGLEMPKALQFELSAFQLILGTKDALVGLKSNGIAPKFTGE